MQVKLVFDQEAKQARAAEQSRIGDILLDIGARKEYERAGRNGGPLKASLGK